MISIKSLLLFYGFTLFSFTGIIAQQKQLHLDQYDFRQGLSNQVVNCIFQDHLGFIWVGTDFGLNRFDGISFTSWYNDPGDPYSLVHNKVLSITEDKQHKLWIGTQEGVSCFDPSSLEFINYSKEGKNIYHFLKKNCVVFSDSANNIWIGHDQGISMLDAARSAFREFPVSLQSSSRTSNKYVSSFNEYNRHIWAATSFGIYRFDKKTFKSDHYYLPLSLLLNANALTSSCVDQKGRFWCGSWATGLVWWDPKDDSLHSIKLSLPGVQGTVSFVSDVLEVEEDKTSWLYMSVINGLIKIKTDDLVRGDMSSLYSYSSVHNQLFPINNMTLGSLFSDRAGNIWVATRHNGLSKINRHGSWFQSYRYSHLVNDEFSPFRIFPDDAGDYWIFTRRDLFHFNMQTKKFVLQSIPGHKTGGYDMVKTDGAFWITTDSGIVQLNNQMKLVKVHGISTPGSLNKKRFRKLFADSKGRLWITIFRQGIAIFDLANKNFLQKFHNPEEPIDFTGSGIPAIIEDHEKKIWLGTGKGLFLYDPAGDHIQRITLCQVAGLRNDCENIQSLHQAVDKKIYIGTGLGFYYFDFNDRKTHPVLLRGQGISQNIVNIAEDNMHNLWLVTNNGLLCYNPSTKQVWRYSLKNGLPHNELSDLYPVRDEFFTGIPGALVMFNPQELQAEIIAPSPVFSSIYINDTNAIRYSDPAPSIRYNQSIIFNFVSLNYLNTSQNQYAYRLQGLDKEWKPIGNEHSLRFSDLPAGGYTLLVKAADSDGKWNDTPATYHFNVTPPFWKTWWFISLCIAVIGGSAYAFYRYRLNAALKMERLRTRIATDLHDDIGATLSSISMYSEAVKKQVKGNLPHLEPVLEKMEESSRNMVSTMSDIVWTINPGNDAGEKLVDRIESYAKDMASINEIQLHFISDEHINGLTLPLELRKNIYLIFKEAFTNALKYSNAKQIWLQLEAKNGLLHIMIKDDGKGFADGQSFKGNGLKNMKNRSEEIHGQLTIRSQPGEGTVIDLQCKIR